MDENPYRSPKYYLERDGTQPKPLPTSPWFWVAFWIVVPLAIANVIHAAYVLIADDLRHP
jgi:hypothetical protein